MPTVSNIDQAMANAALTAQTPSYFGAVSTDNAVNATEAASLSGVVVTGVAPINSYITLNIGTLLNLPVMANATGTWSYTLTQADLLVLGSGTQTITALATVLDSNLLVVSTTDLGAKTFVIDIAAPSVAIAGYTPDTGKTGDGLTSATAITVAGTSEAYATVAIMDGATVVGSTTVGADGTWSLKVSSLSEKAHSFTAVATDLAGNASSSSAYKVTVDLTTIPQ
jgi:hypothetical protein